MQHVVSSQHNCGLVAIVIRRKIQLPFLCVKTKNKKITPAIKQPAAPKLKILPPILKKYPQKRIKKRLVKLVSILLIYLKNKLPLHNTTN